MLYLRRDLSEAREKVIQILGKLYMAEGMASTKAEGSLKGRNETVDM